MSNSVVTSWTRACQAPLSVGFPRKEYWRRGFPGDSVVENPPASAEEMGSSSGPGRSYMPQGNQACVPQLLNFALGGPEAMPTEPTCCNYWSQCALEPVLRGKRSTAMRSLCPATGE